MFARTTIHARLWGRTDGRDPRRWTWRKGARPPLDWNGRYALPPRRPPEAEAHRDAAHLTRELNLLRGENERLTEENEALRRVVVILSRTERPSLP